MTEQLETLQSASPTVAPGMPPATRGETIPAKRGETSPVEQKNTTTHNAVGAVRASIERPQPDQEMAPPDGEGLFRALMQRLPYDMQNSFSHEQLVALKRAADMLRWGNHALDIRFTVPLLLHRYYCVVIGGRERRAPTRRENERARHPLAKFVNVATVGIAAGAVFYVASVFWWTWMLVKYF